jgi:hypothetical protein
MGGPSGRSFSEEPLVTGGVDAPLDLWPELPFNVGGEELPLLRKVDESVALDTVILATDQSVLDSEVTSHCRKSLETIRSVNAMLWLSPVAAIEIHTGVHASRSEDARRGIFPKLPRRSQMFLRIHGQYSSRSTARMKML